MKKFIFIIIFLFSTVVIATSNNKLFIKTNNYKSVSIDQHNKIIKEIILKDVLNKKDYSFLIKKVQKGLTGINYYHYGYKFKNILVDNQTIVISSKNNIPFLITGNFSIIKPKLILKKKSVAKIFKKLIEKSQTSNNKLRFHSKIEEVLVIKGEFAYFTYKAIVEFIDKAGYKLGTIYLDTNTGEEIMFNSHILESLNRKVYDNNNNCIQDLSTLPGELVLSEGDNLGSNNQINDAYINTGITYSFYKNMFNRDSFDNNGINLTSTVNTRFNQGQGCYGENAFFMGNPYNQMVYGNGGSNMDYLSKALDVTAHEITHAVTYQLSDLYYYSESGALNEAISDIFGATAEAWSNSGGTLLSNPENLVTDSNTWKIGEDLFYEDDVFRYMDAPKLKEQPDHYSQRLTIQEDNAAVHYNSGIINLAYYLLVEGGNHPREEFQGMYPDVEGIGLEKAIKIFYEAQVGLFTKGTGFGTARKLLSQATKNLYGEDSNELIQLQRAFDIVGVFEDGDICVGMDSLCEEYLPNSLCIVNIDEAACACKVNFHLNSDYTECLADTREYLCQGVDCNNNGSCIVENDLVFCDCDNGYYNSSNLTCTQNPINPCEGINCDNHGTCTIENNTPICDCETGYVNNGDLHCVEDVEDPCENIFCDNHGSCLIENNTAICSCDTGYSNDGNLNCVEDIENPCKDIDCGDFSYCQIVDSAPVCSCYYGYHREDGLNCVKDPCVGIQCNFNGTCINKDGNPFCECDPGYQNNGDTSCLEETDPCIGIQCNLHGLCVNKDGSPFCECNSGYENNGDIFCVEQDLCEGVNCSNHGSCISRNEAAICVCEQGYLPLGLSCVKDTTDLCQDITCSNHGSCAVNSNKANCICDSGYESSNLECIKNNTPQSGCQFDNSTRNSYLFLILIIMGLILKQKRKYQNKNNKLN